MRLALALAASTLMLGAAPGSARDQSAAVAPQATPLSASASTAAASGVAAAASTGAVPPQASAASRPLAPSLGGRAASNTAAAACKPSSSPGSGESCALPCCAPLRLDGPDVQLPGARLDRVYAQTLGLRGGRPPYQFSIAPGSRLPPGLGLEPSGRISGSATEEGRYEFTLRVQDAGGQIAQQRYALRVLAPAKPSAPAASSPSGAKPVAAANAGTISSVKPQSAAAPAPVLMYSYQLTEAVLPAFKPVAESSSDSTQEGSSQEDAGASAQAKQPISSAHHYPALGDEALAELKKLIEPLFGIDYPTRAMFEAALDHRLCEHTRKVVLDNATQAKGNAPSEKELAAWCPPAWPAASRATSATITPPGASPPAAAQAAASMPSVSLKSLPLTLLPPQVRAALIDLARQTHPPQPLPVIAWQGEGCGCLRDDLDGMQVFGFYPFWMNEQQLQPQGGLAISPPLPKTDAKAQTLGFNMLSRISLLSLPMDADKIRSALGPLTAENTAFIREARRHRTQLDLSLAALDWQLLAPLPQADAEAARQTKLLSLTSELPRAVMELIDTPLPGFMAQAAGWIPGFAEPQHLADGVTLMLEAPPPPLPGEPDLRPVFKALYPQLVTALVDKLRSGQRRYVINLVMDSRDFGDERSIFTPAQLFELIKHAELPTLDLPYFENGRIVETSGKYRSATNVTLNMLVLLAEPTSAGKRALHARIEGDRNLRGINRRVFLRKIIPVLMASTQAGLQYADDLAYFEDNFGGVGFWPLLMQPGNAAMNDKLTTAFSRAADDTFVHPLCAFQCENRWWFRSAFLLTLLAGGFTFAMLAWRCELRRRWDRWVKAGGALVGALFLTLLGCDPALASWREHGALVMLLIVALVLSALWNWVKPKVEMP